MISNNKTHACLKFLWPVVYSFLYVFVLFLLNVVLGICVPLSKEMTQSLKEKAWVFPK